MQLIILTPLSFPFIKFMINLFFDELQKNRSKRDLSRQTGKNNIFKCRNDSLHIIRDNTYIEITKHHQDILALY